MQQCYVNKSQIGRRCLSIGQMENFATNRGIIVTSLTVTPSLDELAAKFPYDPVTDPIGQFSPPPPPKFGGVTVIELENWNAFIKTKIDDPNPTMHFTGLAVIDGHGLNYFTGPLGEYDAVNDWWTVSTLHCLNCHTALPFRLVGDRDPKQKVDCKMIEDATIVHLENPREYKLPEQLISQNVPPPQ